jgi:Rrf2 family protein
MRSAGDEPVLVSGLAANIAEWASRKHEGVLEKALESTKRLGLGLRTGPMLTSKAKYALRAMIDLAEQTGFGERRPLFIGDISERQDIPRRFLENILLELRKHGLVVSHRGKAGGYALARAPDLITFADIIRAIDGPLALTACSSRTAYRRCEDCRDEAVCALRKALVKVREATASILESATLAEAAGLDAPAPATPAKRRKEAAASS